MAEKWGLQVNPRTKLLEIAVEQQWSDEFTERVWEGMSKDTLALGLAFYESKLAFQGQVESAINVYSSNLKHADEVGSIPPIEKPEAYARRKAFNLAFRDDPLPRNQVAARNLLKEQGMSDKEATAELTRVSILYNSPLGRQVRGTTPLEFKKPRGAVSGATVKKPLEPEPPSDTPNPFLAKFWNISAQGKLYRVSPSLAASMAAKAGVSIGATRPVK